MGVREIAEANGHDMEPWYPLRDPYTGEPNGLGQVTYCRNCGAGGVWENTESGDAGPDLTERCKSADSRPVNPHWHSHEHTYEPLIPGLSNAEQEWRCTECGVEVGPNGEHR